MKRTAQPNAHPSFRLLALLALLATLTLAAALSLTSCSSSPKENVAGDAAPAPGAESGGGLADSEADVPVDMADAARKIIKTYDVNSETKAYDDAISSLHTLVADCGGYVESSSASDSSLTSTADASGRYAHYTIRIPAERAEEFVGSVGTLLHVTSSSSSAEDVSETYYSIEARLEELQAERDSLMDILNATETKQDYSLWLTVSQRLSEVRQQIAVYQGQLNRYDGQVAYSTVRLSIREVLDYTAAANGSFGSRLGSAFVKGLRGFWYGLQDVLVWFVGALPVLVLLAAAAVAIILIVRRIRRRHRHGQ